MFYCGNVFQLAWQEHSVFFILTLVGDARSACDRRKESTSLRVLLVNCRLDTAPISIWLFKACSQAETNDVTTYFFPMGCLHYAVEQSGWHVEEVAGCLAFLILLSALRLFCFRQLNFGKRITLHFAFIANWLWRIPVWCLVFRNTFSFVFLSEIMWTLIVHLV